MRRRFLAATGALACVLTGLTLAAQPASAEDRLAPVMYVLDRSFLDGTEISDERWQAASDVRSELEWAATSPATRSPAPLTRSPALLGWIAAGAHTRSGLRRRYTAAGNSSSRSSRGKSAPPAAHVAQNR